MTEYENGTNVSDVVGNYEIHVSLSNTFEEYDNQSLLSGLKNQRLIKLNCKLNKSKTVLPKWIKEVTLF